MLFQKISTSKAGLDRERKRLSNEAELSFYREYLLSTLKKYILNLEGVEIIREDLRKKFPNIKLLEASIYCGEHGNYKNTCKYCAYSKEKRRYLSDLPQRN